MPFTAMGLLMLKYFQKFSESSSPDLLNIQQMFHVYPFPHTNRLSGSSAECQCVWPCVSSGPSSVEHMATQPAVCVKHGYSATTHSYPATKLKECKALQDTAKHKSIEQSVPGTNSRKPIKNPIQKSVENQSKTLNIQARIQ